MRRFLLLTLVLVLGAGVAEAAVRSDGSKPAPSAISNAAASISVNTFNKVGTGGASTKNAQKISGSAFNSGGKPEVLTMNLAWCPHCGANNWALAVALDRFGTLTGLRVIDSGTYFCTKLHAKPCFPHTHGLSFLRAHLQSKYLSFSAVVLEDLKGHRLEKPTRKEVAAMHSFDPRGGFPAVDIGGLYGFVGPAYDPGALKGKTWAQIAATLSSGKGRVGRGIDGSADIFTAAICNVTGGKPSGVCESKGVKAAAAKLPS